MKELVVSIYRHIIPETIRRKYSEKMRDRRIEQANLEEMERCSFGELNKDKTFYVIRVETDQQWGLFSTYMAVASSAKYAIEHGGGNHLQTFNPACLHCNFSHFLYPFHI